MKDLVIVGAGALGQEVAWLTEEINEHRKEWNLLGFLDDFAFSKTEHILNYPLLGKVSDADKFHNVYFAICFGDPRAREKYFNQINTAGMKWANLYSPTVRIHSSNSIGTGVIIGRYTDMTVHCNIRDFVYLNIHVVLGHSVDVGEFSVISPNVTVNGGGSIGRCCQIGANSFIKDISVGDYSTIGASSCVVKPIEPYCVAVGVPAQIIKKGLPNSISRSERGLEGDEH